MERISCSFREFNATLDCFCGWPIGTLDAGRQPAAKSSVTATGDGARWRAGKSRRHLPQRCPCPWGSGPPSNTWAHLSPHPNGISISSFFLQGPLSSQTDRSCLLPIKGSVDVFVVKLVKFFFLSFATGFRCSE